MERFLPPTPSTISDVEPVPEEEIKFEEKALPPESFFPFSPKLPNEFVEEVRPQKYTKEYIDSLKPKMEQELPKKCVEVSVKK